MKQIINRISQLIVLLIFSAAVYAQTGASKSPLKILFVGYDPSKPMPEITRFAPGMMSKEAFTAEYPVRMPAFKELLSRYFKEVKTMDCRDWKASDSDPYDVTIFDFRPAALEPARTEKKANGGTDYISARYLPDNFSKPVVFIASTASEMGSRIGLKLDWLCLCLEADAHHIKAEHAVFKGPLERVVPTMQKKKTPDGIYNYSTGDNIPKEIPMWRIQHIGYTEGKPCRIGLVSRGERFLEGPDTEYLSSGVCLKDVGAVALGRQGNFFLWGFGASPAQMTEEAKKVFVNVVAYMKQFDGKMPITRKYNEKLATTDDVKEIIARATKENFEKSKEEIKRFNERNAIEKKRIEDKKAAGQALTDSEKESEQYFGQPMELPTWESYTKRLMGKYADKFGTDIAAFQKYMTDNFDYIYCDPEAFFSYTVDEDVQKIGVPNHSLKLLETCIDMLKKNKEPQLALKVLKKYTGQDFATATEWNKWVSDNKRKLYFSETDGFRFKINTYN